MQVQQMTGFHSAGLAFGADPAPTEESSKLTSKVSDTPCLFVRLSPDSLAAVTAAASTEASTASGKAILSRSDILAMFTVLSIWVEGNRLSPRLYPKG